MPVEPAWAEITALGVRSPPGIPYNVPKQSRVPSESCACQTGSVASLSCLGLLLEVDFSSRKVLS